MKTPRSERDFYNRFTRYEPFQLSERWQTPFLLVSSVRDYLRGDERVIDIGCGPGLVGKELGRIGWQGTLIGVDIAEERLKEARTKTIYDACVHADTYRLPFTDRCFDVVLSNAMVGLTGIRSVKEMRRLVKPGGYFACIAGEIKAMPWCRDRFKKVSTFLRRIPRAELISHRDLGSGYSDNSYDGEHFELFFYRFD